MRVELEDVKRKGKVPRAVFLTLALVLGACGPQEGDACEPDTPPVPTDDQLACGGTLQCGLTCAGPPGCDGEADFHWVISPEATFTHWCGCDGMTHGPWADWGSLPNTRWQYYGRCENPCAEVFYVAGSGWFTNSVLYLSPVAPECTVCADAELRAPRECVRPDGFELPLRCCDCEDAVLSADNRCVWEPDPDLELARFCCE